MSEDADRTWPRPTIIIDDIRKTLVEAELVGLCQAVEVASGSLYHRCVRAPLTIHHHSKQTTRTVIASENTHFAEWYAQQADIRTPRDFIVNAGKKRAARSSDQEALSPCALCLERATFCYHVDAGSLQ